MTRNSKCSNRGIRRRRKKRVKKLKNDYSFLNVAFDRNKFNFVICLDSLYIYILEINKDFWICHQN